MIYPTLPTRKAHVQSFDDAGDGFLRRRGGHLRALPPQRRFRLFHSDGYIMEILDDLLCAGVDGSTLLRKRRDGYLRDQERDIQGSCSWEGGMLTNLLPFGTPEEVSRETRRIIRETGSEGSFSSEVRRKSAMMSPSRTTTRFTAK